MTAGTAASLINLLGFITGLVLYVMLLWMVLTSRPGSNRLTLLTGILGFGDDTINSQPSAVFADDDGAIWGVALRPITTQPGIRRWAVN